MTIQLKDYQERTLATLADYLTQARLQGAASAYQQSDKSGVKGDSKYLALPDPLAEVPYVCLRLPTGGGKTLLAAHTVQLASEHYLERDVPVVLWLVPSNTIRTQTLETLVTVGHPNREALHAAFDGQVLVMDITEFTQLRPHDMATKAVVVVGTVQTIRTEKKNADSRKVYAHNEHLEPHFSSVPHGFEGVDLADGKDTLRYSFINLLRLYRPLVLVDEAHNNATKLGLEVFERVHASCVIEFTATPANDSNLLHSVCATELKKEEMIKLPIVLTEHKTWADAVRDSILMRARLNELCKEESRYIRPIVLFQAENKNQDVTWQVLKEHLMTEEQIPEEQIAVVTGEQRELDGIDLFDSACPIHYVITVQALKEGWDCSFAYVFCSVANINSAKDVEQILGRVLRMPYAKRRQSEELNRAYAHVSRAAWPNAVDQLHDRLVSKMGFEQQEADHNLETRQPTLPLGETKEFAPLYPEPEAVSFALSDDAAAVYLSEGVPEGIVIERQHDGTHQARVEGRVEPAVLDRVLSHVPSEERKRIETPLRVQQTMFATHASPAARGERFEVPQLCLRFGGDVEVPDEGLFLHAGSWTLEGPEMLSEEEFSLNTDGKTFSIDIEDGHIRHQFMTASSEQLQLNYVDGGYSVKGLAMFFDRRLRQLDIDQPVMLEYARRTVQWLNEARNIPLTAIARARYSLLKILEIKIKQKRRAAKVRGFQRLLFEDGAEVVTLDSIKTSFTRHSYEPFQCYNGAFKPSKHFYARIGDMNKEEVACAQAIEMLGDRVRYWIRNLERDSAAFRLPTSTDFFYPDFVVQLSEDRLLIVEYKGADRLTSDDTKEKQLIGEVWANASGHYFLMASKKDAEGRDLLKQLSHCIGG